MLGLVWDMLAWEERSGAGKRENWREPEGGLRRPLGRMVEGSRGRLGGRDTEGLLPFHSSPVQLVSSWARI